jgi:hypothetical protein
MPPAKRRSGRTITHDHADRVRSFELLAEHWPG